MDGAAGSDSARAGGLRRSLTMLGLVVLAASAVVGSNLFGVREELFGTATPDARPAATGWTAVAPAGDREETVLRSQPWWQRVKVLEGEGATAATVPIDGGAIQWRAEWTCDRGHLLVRAAGQPEPVVDAACPGSGTGHATTAGRADLEVSADGPWRLHVEQQIDVPLHQPPLAAMTAEGTDTVAAGAFEGIDQSVTGDVTVYRLRSGRYALRLTGFYVTPNIDLELRLSPLAAPATTDEFLGAPSRRVAALPVTAGSLNFRLPRGVDPADYGSLVIWCPPVRSAYAAARLRPAG